MDEQTEAAAPARPAAKPGAAAMAHRAEQASRWSLAILFIIAYGYFFQGGGWNQNSRYDTVRSLVEQHTFEITDYEMNTGDLTRVGAHSYANKGPGQAVLAAPVYFILYHVERALGLKAYDWRVVNADAHVLTFWTSGLPAVLLVLAIRRYARQRGASVGAAWLLAAAFGSGTLLWPHSGQMISQNLLAWCLFEAWMRTRPCPRLRNSQSGEPAPPEPTEPPTRGDWFLAGLLLGLAITVDYLVVPAAALFLGNAAWRSRGKQVPRWRWAWVLAGPFLAGALLLIFHRMTFGGWLTSAYANQLPAFGQEGLFLGVFDWPEWRRLYWLSVHPFRGLFYCCPVLALSLLALLPWGLWRERWRFYTLPLALGGTFLLFNLTFHGWTGGWTIGPRYLSPAMAFLFVLVIDVYARWRWVCWPVMLASTFIMLVVTSVSAQARAGIFGPPPSPDHWFANPVAWAFRHFWAGDLGVYPYHIITPADPVRFHQWDMNSPAARWASYNLGKVMGLPGMWSLLPLALVALVAGLVAWRSARIAALGSLPRLENAIFTFTSSRRA